MVARSFAEEEASRPAGDCRRCGDEVLAYTIPASPRDRAIGVRDEVQYVCGSCGLVPESWVARHGAMSEGR